MTTRDVILVNPTHQQLPVTLRWRKTVGGSATKALAKQLLATAIGPSLEDTPAGGGLGLCASMPPSAHGEPMELYVVLVEGVFRFDAQQSVLLPILFEDLQGLASAPGERELPREARVETVVVVHVAKVPGSPEDTARDAGGRPLEPSLDAAVAAAQVYMRAISLGIACWIHDCDKDSLAERLGLSATKRVLFAQTIARRRTSLPPRA